MLRLRHDHPRDDARQEVDEFCQVIAIEDYQVRVWWRAGLTDQGSPELAPI